MLSLLDLLSFVLVVPLAMIESGGRLFDIMVSVGLSTTIDFRLFSRWVAIIAVGLAIGEGIYLQLCDEGRTTGWS